jgi:molybdopterin synthase catalytic subunit
MFTLTDQALSIDAAYQAVRDPATGATVVFLGTVRNQTNGNPVDHLEYEVYDSMATGQMEKIEAEVRSKWNIRQVYTIHRTGPMDIGDISVIIAVSSPHRGDAYAACRHIIERIKQDVPIWKKEFFEDGAVWVDSCKC